MANSTDDITRISIYNRNMKDMAENLRFASQDIARFSRAIKGAIGDTDFFTTGLKKIGTKGEMRQDFYVPTNLANVVKEAINREAGAIFGALKDAQGNPIGREYSVSARKSNMAEGKVLLVGEDAFKELKNQMKAIGGEAYRPDVNKPDEIFYRYPTRKQIGSKGFTSEQASLFSRANEISQGATRVRDEAFSVRVNKEMAKAQADEQKKIAQENRRKEAERRALEKEAEKEQKQGAKESKANSAKMMHWIAIIIAVLTAIADITRRILTASLQRASDLKKEAVNALPIGITVSDSKNYGYFEKATGMDAGTFVKAMSSLQNAFGNITSLDENALKELARVMGGEIKEAVNMGLGKNNPEKMMELILNAYYKRGQQGVNSLGQYVGKTEAERELITALNKAGFGELANILTNMFYTNDFGIYKGRIDANNAFQSYKDIYEPLEGFNRSLKDVRVTELGQVIDDLTAKFARLKDDILGALIIQLSKVIDWIDNSGIFLSDAQKVERDRRNKRLLGEQIKKDKEALVVQEGLIKKSAEGLDFDFEDYKKNPSAYVDKLASLEMSNDPRAMQLYNRILNYNMTKNRIARAEAEKAKRKDVFFNKSEFAPTALLYEDQELLKDVGGAIWDFISTGKTKADPKDIIYYDATRKKNKYRYKNEYYASLLDIKDLKLQGKSPEYISAWIRNARASGILQSNVQLNQLYDLVRQQLEDSNGKLDYTKLFDSNVFANNRDVANAFIDFLAAHGIIDFKTTYQDLKGKKNTKYNYSLDDENTKYILGVLEQFKGKITPELLKSFLTEQTGIDDALKGKAPLVVLLGETDATKWGKTIALMLTSPVGTFGAISGVAEGMPTEMGAIGEAYQEMSNMRRAVDLEFISHMADLQAQAKASGIKDAYVTATGTHKGKLVFEVEGIDPKDPNRRVRAPNPIVVDTQLDFSDLGEIRLDFANAK